jgi:DNA helicase-2/ATP-dependent DNA helicase PcrA
MLELTKLNHHQLEATIAPEGPILVVAGAGTGKTRVLTMRLAYLIEQKGYDSNKILAITFTNKAASEMRTRVASMINNTYVP